MDLDPDAGRILLASLLDAVRTGGDTASFVSPSAGGLSLMSMLNDIASSSSHPEVVWAVVNGSRVDAGVVAADQEWRVVYGVEETQIAWLAVYKRPPLFRGVLGGRAVVVNGPSGAGKSSLIEAISDCSDTPWAAFDEPVLGAVPPEFLIWRETSPTLHDGYLAGIAALAAAGNQVVTSSGGHSYAMFRAAFASVSTLFVGLDCPLDVLLERERNRPGRWGGLAESSIGAHEGWTYDLRLETSHSSPAELAGVVLETVRGFGGG